MHFCIIRNLSDKINILLFVALLPAFGFAPNADAEPVSNIPPLSFLTPAPDFILSFRNPDISGGYQSKNIEPVKHPSFTEYALTASGLALFGAVELFKKDIAPAEPEFSEPNSVDKTIRNSLKWRNDDLKAAALTSDVIFYGILWSSAFWSPLLTDYPYLTQFEITLEAFVMTAMITEATKFTVARQRPYSYYGTLPSQKSNDNLSFFSGHSSLSFAIATSTAYLLSKAHKEKSALIWITSLGLAATVAYLRVAGDKHYFSDVLVGGAVGAATGYFVAKSRYEGWSLGASPDGVIISKTISF